jgi:hypothetical protein
MDGRRGGPTARTPRPQPVAGGRRGTESPAGVHRPGHRHAGRPAVPAPARGSGPALRGGPFRRSPGPSTKSVPFWQLVASPFPDMATDGFALSRTSSPMRRLRMSSCGWTGRRSGFDAPGRTRRAVAPNVSGKMRQNTKKATVVTDGQGRTLWAGAFRPGRMHDQTAVKTEGICELFEQYPQVRAKADAGYRGLAKQFPTRFKPRHSNRRRVPRPKTRPPGTQPAISSPRSASASSTPTLNTSSGEPSSATSDATSTATRPTRQSPPCLQPRRREVSTHQTTRQANTPPSSFVHEAVRLGGAERPPAHPLMTQARSPPGRAGWQRSPETTGRRPGGRRT